MSEKVLVVNADDFGRSPGINRGVAQGFERGIITSATLMVRWPDAEDAATYARAHPELSVGLHVDLAEWEFVDEWRPVYEVIDPNDESAVEREVERQLVRFDELIGGPPTHLDSHQHVHREDPVQAVLRRAGERLGVPVRDVTPRITYSGAFYGQDGRGHPVPDAVTADSLIGIIASLPDGTTELGCHPADTVDVDSVYAAERVVELSTLCDARVRAAIDEHGIVLCSFAELVRPRRGPDRATAAGGVVAPAGAPASGSGQPRA